MNFHFLAAFPIPDSIPDYLESEITQISGRLAAVDERYAVWALRVGVEVGGVKAASERDFLIAKLDGLVAAAYGLNGSDLEHIFQSFQRGWSDASRLQTALETLKEVGS